MTGFDLEALYEALDSQRRARGLSWAEVTKEINALFADVPARPIATSTITGMRSKHSVEGDGVLQMLRWLDRTPESFLPGGGPPTEQKLPDVDSSRILRFDPQAIYAAIETRRGELGMTWQEVADEIGEFSPGSLTRLKDGGRVGFPHVMRIFGWLAEPAASFTRASDS